MLVKYFEWINEQKTYQSYTRDSLAFCGLNQFVEDQPRLKANMDILSENMAYDSLSHTKEGMKLKGSLNGRHQILR